MSCGCGKPREAAECVEMVVGRNVPGGTETEEWVTYLCASHVGDQVYSGPLRGGWKVIEEKRTKIR